MKRAAQLWAGAGGATPLEEATHWMELLAKQKRLPHLKIPAAGELTLFQYFCLDILLVAGTGLILIAYLLAQLTFFLFRRKQSHKGMKAKKT